MDDLSLAEQIRRLWLAVRRRLGVAPRPSLEVLMSGGKPPLEDDRGEPLGSGVPRRPPDSSGSAVAALAEPKGDE